MSRDSDNRPHPTGADLRLEEAETLIWAMLDEQLDDAEMKRLGNMLAEDAAVRSLYIDCVQLHVELREHFGRPAAVNEPSPVVLSNLLPGVSLTQGLPQIVD